MKQKSYAGWVNAVLIPVKQHVVCCGLLPLAASALGGSTAAVLESPAVEIALGVAVPPLVTYGVMWAEQKWANRTSGPGACAHKILTLRNYFRQAALSYGIYAAAHFLLPHHHHQAATTQDISVISNLQPEKYNHAG